MNGTVAPPSSSSTAAATWRSATPSSSAILRSMETGAAVVTTQDCLLPRLPSARGLGRLRLVPRAATGAPAGLQLGLVDVPAAGDQLVARGPFPVPPGRVVVVLELLDDLER